MIRTALTCLLAVTPLVAAPVPKKKAEVADLTALHALIATRAEAGEWSKDDTAVLERTLDTLLENVAKATDGEQWKLPVKLDTANIRFKRKGVEVHEPGVYLVKGNAIVYSGSGSVILATGDVTCMGLDDAVIVARTVTVFGAWNSLLLAAESVGESTDRFGDEKQAGKECFVVAGKTIRAGGVYGGYFHVLAPEFSDHPKAKPPVFARVLVRDAVLLAEPSDRAVGSNGFRKVELKAPIAK